MAVKLSKYAPCYCDTHTWKFERYNFQSQEFPKKFSLLTLVFSFSLLNNSSPRVIVDKRYHFTFEDVDHKYLKLIRDELLFVPGQAVLRDDVYELYGNYLLEGGKDMRRVPIFFGDTYDELDWSHKG